MPPHEVARKLLEILLTKDWPAGFDFTSEPASTGLRREEMFFAFELPSPEADKDRIGTAVIRQADAAVPEFISKGTSQWIALHQYPGNLSICGVWAAEEGEEPEPFAVNLTLPHDWDYGRQLVHVSYLLTNPYVPLTKSKNSVEIARLYLKMALELVRLYPWRGGQIEGTTTVVSGRSIQVANALQFIRQFLHLPLGRVDVARAVGVSESYLTALFKECCDTNVTDYMLLERILRADAMLMRGNLPVATIGQLCGFSSTTYFIRAYRKLRTLTPLKTRQLAAKDLKDHDWAERLCHFERFEMLKHSTQPSKSKLELSHDQRMLLIANASEGTLDLDRQLEGEYAPLPSIGPMEFQLHWPPAPAALRLLKKGEVVSHYRTNLKPCQILIYRD